MSLHGRASPSAEMVLGSFDTDSGSLVLRSGRRGGLEEGQAWFSGKCGCRTRVPSCRLSAFRGFLKMRKYRHILVTHHASSGLTDPERHVEAFRDAIAGSGLRAFVLHACKV